MWTPIEWRMENGEWRMENGEWRMENGEWRMENSLDVDCLMLTVILVRSYRYEFFV